MMEIIQLHTQARKTNNLLPVEATDKLGRDVRQLTNVAEKVCWILDDIQAGIPVQRSLPELPTHAASTVALLRQGMRKATRDEIATCLAVLVGLYGAARDPEILATDGVEVIAAEAASVIAAYSATLALIRPIPGEEADQFNNWQEIDRGGSVRRSRSAPSVCELVANHCQARVGQIGKFSPALFSSILVVFSETC